MGLQDSAGSTVECQSEELPSDYAKKYQVCVKQLLAIRYQNVNHNTVIINGKNGIWQRSYPLLDVRKTTPT